MSLPGPIRLTITVALLCWGVGAFAQTKASTTQAAHYELETIEITGTSRITEQQLREQLGIKEHTIMSDEWMVEARTKLLGLGIFNDVFYYSN
jgi:outer membrane protein assembly factor BamA